ncbi:hypothetical protein [Glycomyces paridis]|uniref:Uncharacterized protein n=1 Tax=Glycomyces paridis TaxID=2126555 RepID=A0A4S8PAJ9_9ACTN|nr:hypothetical protein [Glycomyces paridis]THV27303.1 hypothetical protein E9998_15720 [Glycomyces paridis]
MTQAYWLRQRRPDEAHYLIAPGVSEAVADAAIDRLEGAKDGFGGAKPRWYAAAERLAYWWFAILAAPTAAWFILFAPNGEGPWMNLWYGLAATPLVTGAFAGLLWAAARLQARPGATKPDALAAELSHLVRHAGSVLEEVEGLLDKDPAAAEQIRELAWRAAGVGEANRVRAAEELERLWRLADPQAAAERDEELREIDAMMTQLRRDGKIE